MTSRRRPARQNLWWQFLLLAIVILIVWLQDRSENPGDVPADRPVAAEGSVAVAPHEPGPATAGSSEKTAGDPATRRSDVGRLEADSSPPARSKTRRDPLTEIRPRVFQSAAGLIYGPGSAEGHRLDHVCEHLQDAPEKKVHGVFDGDRATMLAVIDEAWETARTGGKDVKRERQNDRDVLTVNLHRRIGQLGGEAGARAGHPECRFLRLVVEGERHVVTAYPTTR